MTTLLHLKKSIPLCSDLTNLLVGFLEPCLDYSVPKCTHEVALCRCGFVYQVYENILREKFLLEKFCPMCSRPNPHNTPHNIHAHPIPILLRTTRLNCTHCDKTAESYDHKFCSGCQNPVAK